MLACNNGKPLPLSLTPNSNVISRILFLPRQKMFVLLLVDLHSSFVRTVSQQHRHINGADRLQFLICLNG